MFYILYLERWLVADNVKAGKINRVLKTRTSKMDSASKFTATTETTVFHL